MKVSSCRISCWFDPSSQEHGARAKNSKLLIAVGPVASVEQRMPPITRKSQRIKISEPGTPGQRAIIGTKHAPDSQSHEIIGVLGARAKERYQCVYCV